MMKVIDKEKNHADFSEYMRLIVAYVLGNKEQTLYLDSLISQFGLDSIGVTRIVSLINKVFSIKISPVNLYGHKTVKEAADDLYRRFKDKINFSVISLQSIQSTLDEEVLDNAKEPAESLTSGEDMSDDHTDRDRLIILSADNKQALLEKAIRLIDHLKENKYDIGLINKLEKELMLNDQLKSERLAIVSANNEFLLAELKEFIENKLSPQVFVGKAMDGAEKISLFNATESGKEFLKNILLNGGVKKLAALWVMGVNVDWPTLTRVKIKHRLGLEQLLESLNA